MHLATRAWFHNACVWTRLDVVGELIMLFWLSCLYALQITFKKHHSCFIFQYSLDDEHLDTFDQSNVLSVKQLGVDKSFVDN